MEIIYKIAIWTILLLGVGHSGYTFKKYDKIQPEALWFFSASLGLIFSGLLNYINLNFPNHAVATITLGANIFQVLFNSVLAYNIRNATIFSAFLVAFVLLICSIFFVTH